MTKHLAIIFMKSSNRFTIFSFHSSFIYSQKKTIINKYNEIKLNKTNKTLRSNVPYNLLWEKGLQKSEKTYHQA